MQKTTFRFNLDPAHGGIRIVTLFTLITISILGGIFLMPTILRALPNNELPNFWVSLIGGLALGLTSANIMEKWLKRVWPSGRFAEIRDSKLVVANKQTVLTQLHLQPQISLKPWYFVIRQRRSWVPRGWYVGAMLLRDSAENFLIIYSFLKPEWVEGKEYWDRFELLISEKDADTPAEKQLVLRQESLRLNERLRWQHGHEMLPDDFFTLINELYRTSLSGSVNP